MNWSNILATLAIFSFLGWFGAIFSPGASGFAVWGLFIATGVFSALAWGLEP